MQRDDWQFEYGIEEVSDAADRKLTYHQGRLEFWQGEQKATLKTIEDAGLEIRSHDVTGGKRHEVVIDTEHGKRLSEVEGKIDKHRSYVEKFTGWRQVLKAQVMETKPQVLKLDFEDVRFFGLHRTEGVG